MSEGESFSESPLNESQPKAELEDVTAKEYAEALTVLEDFAGDDISDLQNLSDLEQAMAGVGKSFDAAIRRNGKIEAVATPQGGVEHRRVLREETLDVGLDPMELTGTLGPDYVTITATADGKSKYKIQVPLRDSADNGNLTYFATEFDANDSEMTELTYAPTKSVTHAEVQQGYARILQRAADDVWGKAKAPSPDLPSEVTDQFKKE